jgi:hypothetical protein
MELVGLWRGIGKRDKIGYDGLEGSFPVLLYARLSLL